MSKGWDLNVNGMRTIYYMQDYHKIVDMPMTARVSSFVSELKPHPLSTHPQKSCFIVLTCRAYCKILLGPIPTLMPSMEPMKACTT